MRAGRAVCREAAKAIIREIEERFPLRNGASTPAEKVTAPA
jgi:hypothetical protein